MKLIKWNGEKISAPGVYAGIPMDAYHGQLTVGPSVSSSGLRTIFTMSPAHYFDTSYLNTDREDEEGKEAFVLGRAAHHLLLGEDEFSTLFIVRPDEAPDGRAWNGNNNSCKAWLEAQTKAGRTVLTKNQIDSIRGMARALAKHPLIEAGILNGQVERSLVWQDKETGIWLKVRPDVIPNDSGDAADLKTSSHFGYDFDHSASKFRYDMQAALTKWAFKQVLGMEMQSFSLIPVTSRRPHCCDVLTLQGVDITEAEQDLRVALRTFAHCLKTGNWFGPSGSQGDARFLALTPRIREGAEYRRDFLKREIDRATIQPTGAEYLGTP